jgi:hypothetical protein
MSLETAKAARVDLYQSGHAVFTLIYMGDLFIKISTDNLPATKYQLVVGKLLDANGQIISEPFVVPID